MRLYLRRRTPTLPEPLPGYAERRVRLALGRFGSRIARATVYFSDINGPRGGVDKHCSIDVRLRGSVSVAAWNAAPEFRDAVDGAIRRVSRAVEHALARTHPAPRPARVRSRF